jgi:hypothetical protein
MRKLYWHVHGVVLEPFQNTGMEEIQQLVGGKDIRKCQWDTCRVTNNLTLRVICEDLSTYRFYLDWYEG